MPSQLSRSRYPALTCQKGELVRPASEGSTPGTWRERDNTCQMHASSLPPTIDTAMDVYLAGIQAARSPNTAKAYRSSAGALGPTLSLHSK